MTLQQQLSPATRKLFKKTLRQLMPWRQTGPMCISLSHQIYGFPVSCIGKEEGGWEWEWERPQRIVGACTLYSDSIAVSIAAAY